MTAFVTIALQETLRFYQSPDVVGSLTLSLQAVARWHIHPTVSWRTANEEFKICSHLWWIGKDAMA